MKKSIYWLMWLVILFWWYVYLTFQWTEIDVDNGAVMKTQSCDFDSFYDYDEEWNSWFDAGEDINLWNIVFNWGECPEWKICDINGDWNVDFDDVDVMTQAIIQWLAWWDLEDILTNGWLCWSEWCNLACESETNEWDSLCTEWILEEVYADGILSNEEIDYLTESQNECWCLSVVENPWFQYTVFVVNWEIYTITRENIDLYCPNWFWYMNSELYYLLWSCNEWVEIGFLNWEPWNIDDYSIDDVEIFETEVVNSCWDEDCDGDWIPDDEDEDDDNDWILDEDDSINDCDDPDDDNDGIHDDEDEDDDDDGTNECDSWYFNCYSWWTCYPDWWQYCCDERIVVLCSDLDDDNDWILDDEDEDDDDDGRDWWWSSGWGSDWSKDWWGSVWWWSSGWSSDWSRDGWGEWWSLEWWLIGKKWSLWR